MKHGWPQNLDRCLANVYAQHQDLEFVDGCLLYQDRVVIPFSLQKQILKLLHRNHSGITKIKQLARRTVYWFGMNGDIESFVKSCHVCCQMNVVPKQVPHSPWIPTTKPFARIHADFFHFDKKVFLVIVDSFSKWIEVEYMKFGTDARIVKSKFICFFARFGLPDVVVTDGGPPFNSKDLIDFFEKNKVVVMKSPPYNPSSNGQAERMVRLAKDGLKKLLLDPEMNKLTTEDLVSCFLFSYRNTCLEDGSSFPSERLFNYKPKTLLDLIHPKNSFSKHLTPRDVEKDVVVVGDRHVKNRKFDWVDRLSPGDSVYFKNFKPTEIRRWLLSSFIRRVSPNTFQVSLGGRTYLAHQNQLKEAPKEDYQRKVVVTARSERRGTKRGRERYGDAAYEDGEDSFYGFAADSFVFAEDSNDGVDVDMEVDMEREGVSRLSSVDRESQIRDDPVEGSSTQRLPDFSVPSIDNRAVVRRSTRSKRYKKDKDFVYY
ncbi:uncharacterized protein K02A2.6-like isoform X1 [Culex pipiens pallens]|uniref:uncharacterized protein K02A2.6-like isoform X1 n=1 Tax=Culex pipiens pallens TaxID=42434 RepID=UPI0022AA1A8B|nr:uncharacterized protein K02A2.6-like isoform X1 [Culex pipiens pallens]XP_052566993.1 uncharacterized protein K02A2.6-like isoform X1 [Culex pipiens pallens]